MARIRTIKPEFPHSESMGRVSRDSRLLFILLWTLADDEGRLRGNSRMLASLLFPYDDDAPGLIEHWLMELEKESCIIRYQIEDGSYLQICKWLNHQKIDRPSKSKFPQFEEGSRILANPRESSSLDQGSKDQGSKDLDLDQDQGKDLVALGKASRARSKVVEDLSPLQEACKKTWDAYQLAYINRYGIEPNRNAQVNAMIKRFCQNVAFDEAPAVAQQYLRSNHRWYVDKAHDFKYLLADAQKLRTEWATGRTVNHLSAIQAEKTSSMMDSVQQLAMENGWAE